MSTHLTANEPRRVALGLPDGTRVQVTVITSSGSVYFGHTRDSLLNSEPYSAFSAGEFNATNGAGAVEVSWRGDLWLVSFGSDCDVAVGLSGAPKAQQQPGAQTSGSRFGRGLIRGQGGFRGQ